MNLKVGKWESGRVGSRGETLNLELRTLNLEPGKCDFSHPLTFPLSHFPDQRAGGSQTNSGGLGSGAGRGRVTRAFNGLLNSVWKMVRGRDGRKFRAGSQGGVIACGVRTLLTGLTGVTGSGFPTLSLSHFLTFQRPGGAR